MNYFGQFFIFIITRKVRNIIDYNNMVFNFTFIISNSLRHEKLFLLLEVPGPE